MTYQHIGVVGGGTMGSGIAQVAVQSGYRVTLVELDDASAQHAEQRVLKGLERAVERGRLDTGRLEEIRANLSIESDLDAVSPADVVVEAVFEDVDLKKRLFSRLDEIVAPGTPLASNTSTIPIVILAGSTKRPEQVAGLHFFNPVPAMKLVEVIKTPVSSGEVIDDLTRLATDLGKSPVPVNDVPGFVGNLLVVPFLLDAVRAYERGVASKEAIDDVLKLGFNHPMGPLALSDLIGLDIVVDMAESMYDEYREPRYFPPPVLKQLVRLGHLGRKTGRGFYAYD
jgi:3-hydroxybutyryl-CoA dehydrogenase